MIIMIVVMILVLVIRNTTINTYMKYNSTIIDSGTTITYTRTTKKTIAARANPT